MIINSFSDLYEKIKGLYWYTIALIIRPFVKVNKGKIFCWAYGYKQYSCNPRYITEYLLKEFPNKYHISWALNKNVNTSEIDKHINIVHPRTINYIRALYTSEYIFYNTRTYKYDDLFLKKKGQKYIMTWHGATPLKKIEKDAKAEFPASYIRTAIRDSSMCDLMLSNSRYYSTIIRDSFWYNGEILEKGVPRNDIYFDSCKIEKIRKAIFTRYEIGDDTLVILYAPTFRKDYTSGAYLLNWQKAIKCFEKRFNKKVKILIRLHPNAIGKIDIDSIIKGQDIINVTTYPDMQELLCAVDILVTDYSSTMFEMGQIGKPCFLYTVDAESYNRGFYFDLNRLPFPMAKSEDELLNQIMRFDNGAYRLTLTQFINTKMGFTDNGHACEEVEKWMSRHSLSC